MAIAAILLSLCVMAEVVRELCFKLAAGPLDRALAILDWRGALDSRTLWLGIALWGVETLSWIAALGHVPLSVGYPIRAVSYAIIPLAARPILGERLDRGQLAGVVLIMAGVACVGWAG